MQAAVDHFNANILRVRSLGSLHGALKALTTSALDISDILRSQLVLVASALDYYIHEIVEKGMIEIYQNKRPRTKSFLDFNVSLKCVLEAFSSPPNLDALKNEIHENLSLRSYQHPNKITEAIKLISDKNLWSEVSKILNKNPEDIKNQLLLIVDRRNKIVHEADSNPAFPDTRWPIDEKIVNEAVDFIEAIVHGIHQTVTT